MIDNTGVSVLGYAATIDSGLKLTGSVGGPLRPYLFDNAGTSLFRDDLIANSTSVNIGSSTNKFGNGFFTNINLPNHSNVDNTLTTLVTNTSEITYDDTDGADLTTIDSNVTINNDLIVGSTNIGSSVSTLENNINTPSNFITAGTDLEWSGSTLNFTGGSSDNTTGITYDDTGGADLTTISNNVTITKNVEVESNLLLTGTEKILGVDDTGVGYIKLKNLNDDGVLQFNNLNDKLFFQNQTADIMSVESDQVKLFQCLTTNDSALDIGDTTTRFNTGYFSTVNTSTQIDTPEVRSQVFRANNTNHMEFQNNSGTVGMVLTTQGRFGIGAWGVSPLLTPTHNLTVVGDAAISDDLTVTGSIEANGGIEPKYVRKRYMRSGNTNTGSVNGGTWGGTNTSSNNSYPNAFGAGGQRKSCTTNFLTESNGVFTFTEAGTYYIRVTFTADIRNINRHNVALYFSVNDNDRFPISTGSADERGRMGIAYCRSENNVPANTCTFGDMYYFDVDDDFRCKCLLESADGDRNFTNTLPASDIDMYVQYEFEKISDDNVSVRWT